MGAPRTHVALRSSVRSLRCEHPLSGSGTSRELPDSHRREGWTIKAAIDEAVPIPVLSAALYDRFSSRGHADYQNRILSAMRYGFGGHLEKVATK
jgi:6-phosphogluconate dehydrogenase (decarboxylating)